MFRFLTWGRQCDGETSLHRLRVPQQGRRSRHVRSKLGFGVLALYRLYFLPKTTLPKPPFLRRFGNE
jgi:hypothetical protein